MADAESNLTVVAIGASAGGLEALKEFFGLMPPSSGAAFVVIQHLDPSHPSYMVDILSSHTSMKISVATEGTALAADCVYMIPPGKYLRIQEGRLRLDDMPPRDGLRMPIDYFYRSLAQDKREHAICVLFSGSGTDGTLGLREVRAAGGLTIVQQPETAQFDAMLRSAIATGMVDCVLPLGEIPDAIERYRPGLRSSDKSNTPDKFELLDGVLDLLALRTANDFTAYRKGTLLRRLERRSAIHHFGALDECLNFLRADPKELDALAKDMLIGVSSFFRDAEAFEELGRSVVAPLVKEHRNQSPIRIWVPGCSTGEEAYSIAMLFLEELDAARLNCPLQIFASDVDKDSIKFARDGVYPQTIASDVPEPRLNRLFSKRDSTYEVAKRVRDLIVFSQQNLLTEAPFSKLDVITCRNLLIYIEPTVQRKILSLFAFALNPAGYLFLGKSDGMATQSHLFVPVSAKWRIYRRSAAAPATTPAFAFPGSSRNRGIDLQTRASRANFSELNQQTLLQHFDASVVLVDEHGSILHFLGPTGKYLEHPSGDANLNLLNMVEGKLSAKLRIALRRLSDGEEMVAFERVELRPGTDICAQITLRRVSARLKGENLYAVIFEDAPEERGAPARKAAGDNDDNTLVAQLEDELKSMKTEFQQSIDEYETSAEELKAANEEILSVNEELQATNEELDTSKEELQALNEELNTVNAEVNAKIDEITEVNNDLVNFLNSSDAATIFLDNKFRIKRFTPSATRLMNLIPGDVGRPLQDMAHQFGDIPLVEVAKEVLRSLAMQRKEVLAVDGRWFMMTCKPYRTLDDKIDGVILSFNDVSALKRSELSMRESRRFAEGIIDTVLEALVVLDSDLRVVSANRAFYRLFEVTAADTEHRFVFDLGDGQWNIPHLRELLEPIIARGTEFQDFEVEHDFPGIGVRRMLLNARQIQFENGQRNLLLLAIADITERKRVQELVASEERLREHNRQLEQQLIASGRLVSLGEITASMAHEFNNPLGIVLGFAQDLLKEGDPSNPNYQALTIINEEAGRCQKIIQSLMEYARPGNAQPRTVYLGAVIDASLRMLENRAYKQKVAIARQIQPDLPQLHADPQQLEQVLVNLYLNALDAMLGGGTLTVGAALQAGGGDEQIVITIADTGLGIDEHDLHKIFEPFYTARKKAGLGLGLPICRRIVDNHGGRIEVESELEKGTTFKIFLPTKASSANRAGFS